MLLVVGRRRSPRQPSVSPATVTAPIGVIITVNIIATIRDNISMLRQRILRVGTGIERLLPDRSPSNACRSDSDHVEQIVRVSQYAHMYKRTHVTYATSMSPRTRSSVFRLRFCRVDLAYRYGLTSRANKRSCFKLFLLQNGAE